MKKFSLNYIKREPLKKTAGKAPLMLLLHGYGSNEEDLFGFADELPEECFVISARAPLTMQPYGNAWYTIHWDATDGKWSDDAEAVKAREQISSFIDEAVEAYDLDAKNVTLLGFSQGTILSYAVALTYPKKVKNLIALSGYINEAITKPVSDLSLYNDLNVFCSHGTQDPVIPIAGARMSIDVLDKLNIKAKLREYPVGHGVAPQNFQDLKVWIKEIGL